MVFKAIPFTVTYAVSVSDERQAMTLLLDLAFITAEAGERHIGGGGHHTSPSTFVHLQFSITESGRKRYKDNQKIMDTLGSGLCNIQ